MFARSLALSVTMLSAALMTASAARAADPTAVEPPQAVETREIVIDLGMGAQVQPKFPTANRYEVVPYPLVGLRFLRLPVLGEVVTGRERALSIYPSFGFIGERKSTDASYLVGTPDTDFAFELGAGVAYRTGPFRAFVQGRYGVTGHNGFVAEAGVDAVINPFDRLELRVGPRVSVADEEYMETYFGVDVATPFLDAYSPSAGVKDVGIAAEATYELTEKVRIHGRAGFFSYVGEALDSPITENGSSIEGTVGIGLTYRFGLDLF